MDLVPRFLGVYRRAYTGLPRRAWILFGVNLVNASGTMVLFFLSLYFTRRLGFSASEAGRALSLYGAGSLAGAFLGGWLSDRIGSTAVQKLSLALSGVLLVAMGQVRAAAVLLPALFAFGAVSGSLYPANAASMARVCPPELHVKGFALNRLAGNLGVTVGPALGGLLALRDYRLLFWVDGLTCLAAAGLFVLLWPASESRLRRDEVRTARTGGVRSPWRDAPFLGLLAVTFAFSLIFVQLLSTFPLYMRGVYGLAEDAIGRLLAVNTVLIVLFEMALMEVVRRFPLTRMINVSFILLGAGFGLIPLGRGFGYAALTVAVWTFGEMLSMPLFTSLISGRADPESRGRYLGLFSFAFSLGFIVGPVLGTEVYERWGGEALWFGCGAAGFVLAGSFSLLKRYLGDAPPAES
ncbi:MAG: MFS transporter [Candidatus Aminicenantes bacterium]|nr:MFS transporter [Candidatus Aminicenantes bacterium]